ncbi:MAG TPA: hypothetical protein VFE13_12980 [Caulobacteraceae bacterium]|jgi:hypothetical protein|nr:hypothetical protein [Caulobacteraceae bacterium]
MSAILYPVAANAEAALAQPKGRAVREREARELVGGPVRFVTETTGPAFPTREAALDAYVGRLDDPRRSVTIPPEDRFLSIAERIDGGTTPAPVEPAFRQGRRWPKTTKTRARTVFRLVISYWRLADAEAEAEAAAEQARALRRRSEAAALDAVQLRALARQPLRPVKPQQPLDAGLFEMPAPEAPHILIPDE